MTSRGYYGIGIERGKTASNVGTLWRSAYSFGAAFIFTVGRRYPQQASDTAKAWRHVPMVEYSDIEDLLAHLPFSCPLVGVEIDDRAVPLERFSHPERAIYLLGAEDHGLTDRARQRCHRLIQLRGRYCLNVAVAGSIVLHDRVAKEAARMDTPMRKVSVA